MTLYHAAEYEIPVGKVRNICKCTIALPFFISRDIIQSPRFCYPLQFLVPVLYDNSAFAV